MAKVTLRGWQELVTNLLRPKTRIVSERLDGLVYSLGHAVRREVPKKSKKLHDSIVTQSSGAFKREVVEGMYYGRIVRLGVESPYPIYPKYKKALYWPGIIGDHPIRRVKNHPKKDANPYDKRALDKSRKIIESAKAGLGDAIAVDLVR